MNTDTATPRVERSAGPSLKPTTRRRARYLCFWSRRPIPRRYITRLDGEWFDLPRSWSKLSCCDCKLTHLIRFRTRHGRLQMQAIRDVRATASRRRGLK